MPDTPRTEAELQAIFDDNTTGNISPQDMRDFVVSVYPTYEAFGAETLGALTIPATDFVPLDLSGSSFYIDEGGWADANAYASDWWSGYTWPAQSSLSLPPGLYYWTAQVFFTTDPDSAANCEVLLDWLDFADAGYAQPTVLDRVFAGGVYLLSSDSSVN